MKGSLREGIKGAGNRCSSTINQYVHLPSRGLNRTKERISQRCNAFRHVLGDQVDRRRRGVRREGGIELALGFFKLGHGAGEKDELCTLVQGFL